MQLCGNKRLFGKKTSLIFMFIMTASFFVAEIVVGYMTNSTALVADSFHMLSDVLSLVVGFMAVVFSKKSSKSNTYGWARAEVLGALTNAVFLYALCFSIIVSAVKRLIEIEKIEDPLLIIYVGSAGLFINLIGLFLFHGHSHGHHHHHDHDYDHKQALVDNKDMTVAKTEHTHAADNHLNMKGVFLHVLGDALGSVVVLISAITIHFAEGEWRYYLDPAMSLVIAAIIICTTWPLLKRSGLILLQNPPSHISKDDMINELIKVHGIQAIHEFHVWQLSGNISIASVHITMHRKDSFNETALEVSKLFHEKGVHSVTLQPEYYDCSDGQSLCGAEKCHYLRSNNLDPTANDVSMADRKSLNEGRSNSFASSCLHPCITPDCKKFQCCSESSAPAEDSCSECEESGVGNPCYVNVESVIQLPTCSAQRSNIPLASKSNFKSSTLPRSGKQHQNYSYA